MRSTVRRPGGVQTQCFHHRGNRMHHIHMVLFPKRCCLKIVDGRKDGQTDDNDDDGRWVITIAHLELLAQVS